MIDNVLSKKRCVILLIVACCIYFVLNIIIWDMNLVVATSGAICAAIAFGLFLYFIRNISKKETALNLAKVGSKNRVCPPPETIAHLGIQPGDLVAFVLKTDKNDKNYAFMHPVKEGDFKVKNRIKKKEWDKGD